MNRTYLLPLVLSLFAQFSAHAENWPQWRGIKGDGISSEKDLPIQWSQTNNIAWKAPLPGGGGASPVVWGERVFVTSVDGEDLVLLCFNTDGKQKWKQVV